MKELNWVVQRNFESEESIDMESGETKITEKMNHEVTDREKSFLTESREDAKWLCLILNNLP